MLGVLNSDYHRRLDPFEGLLVQGGISQGLVFKSKSARVVGTIASRRWAEIERGSQKAR